MFSDCECDKMYAAKMSNLLLLDLLFQAHNAPKLISGGDPPRTLMGQLTTLPLLPLSATLTKYSKYNVNIDQSF